MKHFKLLVCLLVLAAAVQLSSNRVWAADEPASAADGPWVSSVAWQGNRNLLGTKSQGLLFRPAEVVKAAAKEPQHLSTVGEAESSLWDLLPLKGGSVVASDYKGGVHLFSDGQPKSFTLEARWIRSLAKAPAEGELLAGTEDGKLLVLSVPETKEIRRVDAHEAAIFDVAVSKRGDKIATAAGDGTIKLFSWPELETLGEMSIGKDAVWSITFVNGDKQLVSGGADRAIQLWDVAEAKPIVTLATARNWVTSLVALPKSSLVVAGCMDGSMLLVDYKAMHAVTSVEGPGSAIWSLALSPNGKRLAMGTRKHGISITPIAGWRQQARQAAEEAKAIRPPAPKT